MALPFALAKFNGALALCGDRRNGVLALSGGKRQRGASALWGKRQRDASALWQQRYPFVMATGALLFNMPKEEMRGFPKAPTVDLQKAVLPSEYQLTGLKEGLYEILPIHSAGWMSLEEYFGQQPALLGSSNIDEESIWANLPTRMLYHQEISITTRGKVPLGECLSCLPKILAPDLRNIPGITSPFCWAALERGLKQLLPLYSVCPEYLRHKCVLLSPHLLIKLGVPFTRIIQRPGQGIVTMEAAAHQVAKVGPSVAMAWNAATRNWLKYGRLAGYCACLPTTVRVNVEEICRHFMLDGIERGDAEVRDIWSDYNAGRGCSLYWFRNGEPFQVNDYWYKNAKETESTFSYKCCQEVVAGFHFSCGRKERSTNGANRERSILMSRLFNRINSSCLNW
ncbi:hypothetical protein niasHT_022167 [Heterodera trifolii]|uniref:JmjC domain-containing protein n=1 Tax=Heterodera trifolii TaxID=157864 RepID=A0ABD2KPY3_9BILA